MPAESRAPIPPAVAQRAVQWLIDIDDAASAPERARHQARLNAWLAEDPAHARAWARIAEVDGRLRRDLHGLPPALAYGTLTAPGLVRRHAAKLAWAVVAGSGAWMAARQTPAWQQLAADVATATGERRALTLADGSRLWLNTASAVDLRYGAAERRIVLRTGELLMQSAPDTAQQPPRPLLVQTAQGTVRAIGTRFSVRQLEGDRTAVAVQQGAVALQPTRGAERRLEAGSQARFTATAIGDAQPLRSTDSAWIDGMLVADDMALGDFIAELARHRPGVLRCAPDAAGLRVSGSYPLADTDRVLAALTLSLPVELHSRTRWWVTVQRAAD